MRSSRGSRPGPVRRPSGVPGIPARGLVAGVACLAVAGALVVNESFVVNGEFVVHGEPRVPSPGVAGARPAEAWSVALGTPAFAADDSGATFADQSPEEVAKQIDRILADAWKANGITPNRLASDEEFVRRVHFDLVGTPPTAIQAEDFLKDPSPRKREKLVETLLASPGFARHFANQWAEVLVGVGTGDDRRDFVPATFMPWLERQFATARPWGEVVTDLLTASGTSYANPPVNFSARLAFTPSDLAGVTSKAFLGVQIQCAQCHDHPYEEITQADFQGFSAFWGRIRLKQADIPYEMFGPRAIEAEQRRFDRDVAEAVKNGIPEAEARVLAERKKLRTKEVSDLSGDVRLPRALAEGRTKLLGEAATTRPKFLKAESYADRPEETRRAALARWVASPSNPYTSKALANRVWGWMLGRGIVHPVDDFSSVNVPVAPEALDLLAKDTAAHGFDQRRLVRIIAATRAYQTSTAARERPSKAVDLFAAGPLKALSPQQSFDALNVALGVVADGRALTFSAAPVSAVEMDGGRGAGMRVMDMTGDAEPAEVRAKPLLDQAARNFFKTFDDDEGGGGADFEGTVPQGLFLLNSQVVNGLLSNPRVSVLPKVVANHGSERDRVRHLFLRTLAREPRSDELLRFVEYVKSAPGKSKRPGAKKDRRFALDEDAALAPYADVLWVLVSSSEFGTNH